MTLKNFIIIAWLGWFFSAAVFADSGRLNDLIDQLNGKTCRYEFQGNTCVKRGPFAFLLRRHDKEYCVIEAAKALGMTGREAQAAVPALIQALAVYHNVDSGDGIIPVRSEIALALGAIGDPAAIEPLKAILASNDPVTLSASAAVPPGYQLAEKTSHKDVAAALGMLTSQAKDAESVKKTYP